MRGSMLKSIMSEQGINTAELARRLGISPQTLYSMVKRDNQKVDFDLMVRICAELDVPVERFCDGISLPKLPTMREWQLLGRYRRLDDAGKELAELVVTHELGRCESAAAPAAKAHSSKVIPLYLTPAAAGYASPAEGEDYEECKLLFYTFIYCILFFCIYINFYKLYTKHCHIFSNFIN